jgi:hypothetical protein
MGVERGKSASFWEPLRRFRPDRRASRRFSAMTRPALLGWVREGEFRTAPVSLRDISLCGVLALGDVRFPESETVWLRMSDHPDGRWVPAVVVDVKRVRRLLTYRRSPSLIRMRFGLGCPYTFFHSAVDGKPRATGAARSADRIRENARSS